MFLGSKGLKFSVCIIQVPLSANGWYEFGGGVMLHRDFVSFGTD